MTPQATPRLSILIPAYAYAAGVERILRGLWPWPAAQVELIVFDDSPGEEVAAAVQGFVDAGGGAVDYRHQRPALGAVPNWNALLDAARGDYVWLLHHDEFPIGPGFIERLLAALQGGADALLLDCLLVDPDSGRNRRHVTPALRLHAARHAPDYLYRRNLIGPVSTLVLRRSRCPRFETALKWKVDVAFYAALFSQPGLRVDAAPELAVGSVLHRDDSITAGLQQGLAQRERDEHAWLRAHGSLPDTRWLADAQTATAPQRLRLAAEKLLWLTWRALGRLPYQLGRSTRPAGELLPALHPQPPKLPL